MTASFARSILPLAATVLAWLVLLSPAQCGELKMGGTGSATELLKHLGRGFASESETQIEVIPSLGSSGGIRALGDGVLDLAVSGRPLKPDEKSKGLKVGLVIRTPFVLATSHPNPNGLTRAAVVEAFSILRPGGTAPPSGSFSARDPKATPPFWASCFPDWLPPSRMPASGPTSRSPRPTRITSRWPSGRRDRWLGRP